MRMKDLQHDNAKHALDFYRVVTAGIICYLLLDVTSPPPRLLLRDPRGYLASVGNAAGVVILQWLFCCGIPVLAFQRAIRAADGDTIKWCTAYAFHCHRSLAFKPKSVYITMVAVMGMACAHPALQSLLAHASCLSLLGCIYMAFDRFLEYVNMCQQQRGTAFKSFDNQLQFSQFLKAMIHVDSAWKTADGNGTGIDDGIPTYLYNDVAQIRRKLRETVRTPSA